MVNYKDEFFENLLIVTAKFGKVFITDDGNMYRQQWQAESRMTDAQRVHKQVPWCSIEKGKEPLTCEELDK